VIRRSRQDLDRSEGGFRLLKARIESPEVGQSQRTAGSARPTRVSRSRPVLLASVGARHRSPLAEEDSTQAMPMPRTPSRAHAAGLCRSAALALTTAALDAQPHRAGPLDPLAPVASSGPLAGEGACAYLDHADAPRPGHQPPPSSVPLRLGLGRAGRSPVPGRRGLSGAKIPPAGLTTTRSDM